MRVPRFRVFDDEGEPAVAEQLGGADGGEADEGEERQGAAQEGEE